MKLIKALIVFTLLASFGVQAYEWNTDTHLPISGDFNGDGRTDLLLQAQNENGQTFISFSFHEEGLRFDDFLLDPDDVGVKVSQDKSRILVADVNADGFDDILVLRNSKEKVHVLLSRTKRPNRNPTRQYRIRKHYRFGLEDLEPGLKLRDYEAHLGDLNGDNRTDLILQPKASGSKALAVLSDEDAKFGKSGTKELKFGINLAADRKILHIADFNGDLRDDILVQRIRDNDKKHHLVLIKNRINRSQAIEIDDDFLNLIWHADTTQISLADFDQNGLADLVFSREQIIDPNYTGPQIALGYLKNQGQLNGADTMPVFQRCDFSNFQGIPNQGLIACIEPQEEQASSAGKSTSYSKSKTNQQESASFGSKMLSGSASTGTIDASPSSCELANHETYCSSTITATRTDFAGIAYGNSCIFRGLPPGGFSLETQQPLICGNNLSYPISDIAEPGETFYYRLNSDPYSQILDQVTVSVSQAAAQIPPMMGSPSFNQIEASSLVPPLDVGGQFQLCWQMPQLRAGIPFPESIEWQSRLAPVNPTDPWTGPINTVAVQTDSPSPYCVNVSQAPDATLTKTYEYRIRACTSGGCSDFSQQSPVAVRSQVVPPIENITLVNVEQQPAFGSPMDHDGLFTLDWSSVAGAEYFVSYEVSGVVFDEGSTSSNTISLDVSDHLQPFRQFGLVKITACPVGSGSICDENSTLAYSALQLDLRENAAPASPGNLTFHGTTSSNPVIFLGGLLPISWENVGLPGTEHQWELLEAGHTAPIQSFQTNASVIHLVEEATHLTRYLTFRVRAVNAVDASGWVEGNITLLPLPPEAPENLTAPEISINGNYTVTWNAPSSGTVPTEYQLYESADDGQTWVLQTLSSPSSQSIQYSAKPDGSYRYSVLACHTGICNWGPPDSTTQEGVVNVFVGLPPGGTLASVTQANFLWEDESNRLLTLSWSYPEDQFNTQGGRPDTFQIIAPMGCVSNPASNCVVATVDATDQWQTLWSSMTLDLGNTIGSTYQIRACQTPSGIGLESSCSRSVNVSISHSGGSDLADVPAPQWINPISGTHNAEQTFTLSWQPVPHPDISYYEIEETRYDLPQSLNEGANVSEGGLKHFTEDAELELLRVIPAKYRFRVRGCRASQTGLDQCTPFSASTDAAASQEFEVFDALIPAVVDDLVSSDFQSSNNTWYIRLQGDDTDFLDINTSPDYLSIGVFGSRNSGDPLPPMYVRQYVKLNGAQTEWQISVPITAELINWDPDGDGTPNLGWEIASCKNNGVCNFNAVDATPVFDDPNFTPPTQAGQSEVPGGPDDLKPGEWFDPEYAGTGWSFYWASELRYPSIHELYGDTYDLLAFWFTYRKIDGRDKWEPVWLFSLLKHDDFDTTGTIFKGMLYYPQKDPASGQSQHINAGSLEVMFDPEGESNTQAMVMADITNLGGMVDSYTHTLTHVGEGDVLTGPGGDTVNCQGFGERTHNPIDHYQGLWWRLNSGNGQEINEELFALSFIERNFESMIVPMYDSTGEPIWVRGEVGSAQICDSINTPATEITIPLHYISEGFDPSQPTPDGYSISDHYPQLGTAERQFEDNLGNFNPRYGFSINANTPSGRVINRNDQPQPVQKAASFHDIRFFVQGQNESVTECRITSGTYCDIELTWFTDDLYPNFTAYHCGPGDVATGDLTDPILVKDGCTEISVSNDEFPSVIRHPYNGVTESGPHIFVLHNGRFDDAGTPVEEREAAIIAQSAQLTVNFVSAPQEKGTVPDALLSGSTLHQRNDTHDPEIGAVGGQGGVSGGSATYSIPFVIPPGRQGMQPNLGLSYSSRAGNGHVGMGWSISGTSSIHRCPKTEAQDNLSVGVTFTNTDRLCLDGQRLIKVNSEPNLPVNEKDADYWEDQSEYRTEIDSFVQVIMTNPGGSASSTGQSFVVRGKDQIKRTYDFAVLVHSDTQDQAVSWRLGEERDPANNRVTYHYVDDSSVGLGEVVLGHVRYTGSNTELGNRMVHFDYEARCVGQQSQSLCDISTSHLSGYESRQTQRLMKVTTCVDVGTNATDCEAADKVREYNLTYLISNATQRLLLERVQECAYPEGGSTPVCRGGTASGGTLFTWNQETIGFEQLLLGQDHETLDDVLVNVDADDLNALVDVDQACQGSTTEDCLQTRLSPRIGWRIGGDYDGDGIREVWLTRGEFVAGTPEQVTYSHRLAKINAQGIVTDSFDATNLMDSLISRRGVRGTGDFDNDGRTDFLVNDGGTLAYYRWKPCLQSTPCNWDINQFEPISTGVLFEHEDLDPGYGALQPNVLVADINVDGLLDLIVADPPEQANSGEPTIVRVYTAQPAAVPGGYQWVEHTSFSIDTFTFAVFNAGPVTYPEQLNGVTDYDGDGRPELMISSPYFRGANEMGFAWTKLVRFDADEQNQLMPEVIEIYNDENSVNSLGMARSPFSVYSQFADVNGDGLQDYVYIEQPQNSPSETPNWKVQINTGRNLSEWTSDDDDYELFAPPIDTQSNIGVYGQIGIPPQGFDAARWRPRFSDSLRVGDFDNDGKAEILYPKNILIRHCVEIITTLPGNPDPEPFPYCAVGPQESDADGRPFEDNAGLSSWDDSIYAYEYINFDLAEDGSISVSTSSNSNIVGKRQLEVDDLFGDGYTDTFGPIGCRSPFAICDLQDVTTGESFTGEQSGTANPLAVRNVLINRGLLGGDANANQVDPVPQPLDTLASSHDDLDRQMFWDYKPLSFLGGARSAPLNTPPLYYIPEDRNDSYLLDANAQGDHFYFASSMYVVSQMTQSNGLSADGSQTNDTFYSYGEAIYNNKGRGFQGFRTIVTQQDIGDGNDLRTTTRFHQFFPLAGRVEETYLHLGSEPSDMSISTGGTGIEQTLNQYVEGARADGTYFPYMTRQDSVRRKLEPSDRQMKVTETVIDQVSYDGFGNLTGQRVATTDYDADGLTALTTQTVTVSNHYDDADENNWWVNRLERTVTDSTRTYGGDLNLASLTLPNDFTQPTEKRSVTQYTVWNNSLRKPNCSYTVAGDHDNPTSVASCATTFNTWGTNALVTKTGFVYDALYGNVTSTTVDATDLVNVSGQHQARTTLTAYTSDGYFVSQIINPKWHRILTQTEPRYGLPTEVTDANDLLSRMEYDAFGQQVLSFYPDASHPQASFDQVENHYAPRSGTYVTRQCDSTVPDASKVAYCIKSITDGAPVTVAYVDQLGRAIVTDTEGRRSNFVGDQTIRSVQRYNARGQQIETTVPYYVAEHDPDQNVIRAYSTSYAYDGLGRMASKRQQRETNTLFSAQDLWTNYIHDGLQTTIWVSTTNTSSGTCAGSATDPLNSLLCVSRTYSSNENLLRTTDAHGMVTLFWADGLGNPSIISDPHGNLTLANYNDFSHRLKLFDPNMGNWTFVYNGLGELTSQVDGKGQEQRIYYDELGRTVKQEARVNGGSLQSTDEWMFDQAGAQGLLISEQRRLGSASTPIYKRDYNYDTVTRPTGHSTTIAQGTFEIENTNDSYFGRPLQLTYPAYGSQADEALSLYQRYDINGYLIEEGESVDHDQPGFLRKITDISPNGGVRRAVYDNGVEEVNQYFESTGQAAVMCATPLGGSCNNVALMSFDYEYDRFGNLKYKYNHVDDTAEVFAYDRLHRLLESQRVYMYLQGPPNNPDNQYVTYTYDALGNITSKGDYASNYQYGNGAGPNAVTSIDVNNGQTANLQYDGNGNLSTRTRQSNGAMEMQVIYDVYNKPTTINRNATELTFAYGSNQQRYAQTRQGLETIYIDKLYERIDQTEHKYYLGDWGVWTVGGNDAGMKYLHKDRLGSVMAISDTAGALEGDATRGFDPFGKPREGDWRDSTDSNNDLNRADLTTRGFTQHEHLNSVELIHMNGRTYDYNLGRFLSVDPFIQFPTNSQSLNPYSYIMNNPLSGADPSGYLASGEGGDLSNCGFSALSCITGRLSGVQLSGDNGRETGQTPGGVHGETGSGQISEINGVAQLGTIQVLGSSNPDNNNTQLRVDALGATSVEDLIFLQSMLIGQDLRSDPDIDQATRLRELNEINEAFRRLNEGEGSPFMAFIELAGALGGGVTLGASLAPKGVALTQGFKKLGDEASNNVENFVFRGDTRDPSIIFNEGFQPRGGSRDLLLHALDNTRPPSIFVSTSKSASVAGEFADNVFVIRPRNGVDVNAVLGRRSPFPDELEIAIPRGVKPADIRGVTLSKEGVSKLNPNFDQ